MSVLSALAFFLLMMLAVGLVGLIGSIVLAVVGQIHRPLLSLGGRWPALAALTIANALVVIGWTAFVMLWAERGTPPYNPPIWLALFVSAMLIIAPTMTAYGNWRRRALEIGVLKPEQRDLGQSLEYIFMVQVIVVIWMYFDRSALHWWRWLPLTG